MSSEKPKYNTIDEIIDAHRSRPEPQKLPAKDGQWVFTKDKVYKWFTTEELLKSGIKLASAQPELPSGDQITITSDDSLFLARVADWAIDGQD